MTYEKPELLVLNLAASMVKAGESSDDSSKSSNTREADGDANGDNSGTGQGTSSTSGAYEADE